MSAYYNENNPYAAQWLRNLIASGQIADGDVDERSIVAVQPDDLRGYTQCHFFAGIAAWSHALRLAGWADDRPVWTGSCPCQPFSSAGAGKGADDPRHLWPVWFDLIRQCRPATVFGEQVEAAIKHGWLDLVQGDLENAGYACGAVCLPAGAVGAPHQRQRLWFVANAQCEQSQCQSKPATTSPLTHQPTHDLGGCSGSSIGLGDTQLQQRQDRESRSGNEHEQAGWIEVPEAATGFCNHMQPQAAGHVADADIVRWREGVADTRRMQCGNRAQGPVGRSTINGGLDDAGRPSPTDFWADADWLYCRDDKWRPTEPGTFPLVDGSAFKLGSGCTDWEGKSRAGMLKAYGNAIVPQVAATVISAFMEYAP